LAAEKVDVDLGGKRQPSQDEVEKEKNESQHVVSYLPSVSESNLVTFITKAAYHWGIDLTALRRLGALQATTCTSTITK
jgi:hypothetical protein